MEVNGGSSRFGVGKTENGSTMKGFQILRNQEKKMRSGLGPREQLEFWAFSHLCFIRLLFDFSRNQTLTQ